MGYSSDIAIAVHKNVIALDLIDPIIPDALKNEPYQDKGDARYWYLSGWKWYQGYPEVASIEQFFDLLDEKADLIHLPAGNVFESYGALRIGEDDNDVQTWGDPGSYDIYLKRGIDAPFIG
jgi:hypothetical protein